MQLSLIPGKNKFVPALLLHSATYPEKLLRTTKYRAVITKFLHKTQHLNILNKIANKLYCICHKMECVLGHC